MQKQYSNNILMVRPFNFGFNDQTAVSNSFQTSEGSELTDMIAQAAIQEFDDMVLKLKQQGINVFVMHDSADPVKPDAIFPNNWVSFHENGTVITYPMLTENRRSERREEFIDALSLVFDISKRYSFEIYEEENQYLEGTGSMILDRVHKIVYACLSPRTNVFLLDKFCLLMGYDLIKFTAFDRNGSEIYHTNVMLTVCDDYAIVCLDCIGVIEEREQVENTLIKTKKQIITISLSQMEHFAGNMLQVEGFGGKKYLVMSEQAYKSLDNEQITQIEKFNDIINVPLYTIEKYGGGSARCMMGEIFLPKK